ncbi:alpha/beta hydrolase [Bifidobacterium felsineum]|uniref:Esterase n=1 Tax=Bifidobacterium felsineum TaxID=2045440 RepID=A0A2M9HLB9_9BIFI|nr:esterase [Bifidobacterium felsineum]
MTNSHVLRTLMDISLVRGPLPWTIWTLTAIVSVALLVMMVMTLLRPHGRDTVAPLTSASASGDSRQNWPGSGVQGSAHMPALPVAVVAAVGTGIVGLVVAWLISDVIMVFGVSFGWAVIFTIAAGFAGMGFAIAATVRTHHVQRVLAALLIPLALLSSALHVDGIYGEYQTVGSLVGYSPYESINDVTLHKPTMTVAQWRKAAAAGTLPADVPTHGKVLTVDIPNTKSQFAARRTMVYLPPAALAKRTPSLPGMELLAGQPGSPGRLMAAGGIAAMMDSYAASHHGLAPVVVVPDQNGADAHNSLCADTTQGKAETYLTQDVVDWAKQHLPVAKDAAMWAIGGFSQGGTCTTQLAPRHPELYGAMLPVDGELKPTSGSVENMVRTYFGGNRAAYDAQVPVNAIAATGSSSQALFAGAGEQDTEAIKNMDTIADAAYKAGMEVTTVMIHGTGHDWHAVQAVWRPGLAWFGQRTGLGDMTKAVKDYPQVDVQRQEAQQ